MTFETIVERVKRNEPIPKIIGDTDALIYHYLASEIEKYQNRKTTKKQLEESYLWVKHCYSRISRVQELALSNAKIMTALGGLRKQAMTENNQLALLIFGILDGTVGAEVNSYEQMQFGGLS